MATFSGNATARLLCPIFTELKENSDEHIFYCEYEEWAYGIFATLLIIMILIPLSLLVYCLVRNYNQRVGYQRIQRQRSVSSYDSRLYGSQDTSYEVLSERNHRKPPYLQADQRSKPTGDVSLDISSANGMAHQPLQLSASAPQLSAHLHGGSSNRYADQFENGLTADMKHAPGGKRCSFCNDNSAMLGIFCEECSQGNKNDDGSPHLQQTAPRCCSDSCVSTRPMPTPDITENNLSLGSSPPPQLYPKLDAVLPHNNSITSWSDYPMIPSSPLTNEQNPGDAAKQRRDYDSYLLQMVQGAAAGERDGHFLVRDSMSRNDCKVLMLYCCRDSKMNINSNNIMRYLVCPHGDSGLCIEGSNMGFNNLDSLLEFYRANQVQLPCRLTVMV